jgi:uncharacterized membrane protein YesL
MAGTSIFSPDSKLMQVMEWLTRMLHIQVMWILFSMIGLFIGGIFPATFVMFAIIRKWIHGDDGIPVFKTFKDLYKKNFIKTNIIGWGMAISGASIFYYIKLFSATGGIISIVLVAMALSFALLYAVTALFIIPVYVHFDVDVLEMIKHAVIIAVSHPLHVLLMVITFIGFWYLMFWLPVLLPFIGFSILAYFIMRIANAAFISTEKKLSQS